MKRIAEIIFLTAILISGGTGAKICGQDLVEVFDGRETFPSFQNPATEDNKFFYNLLKNREADLKKDLQEQMPADCETAIYLETVLEGSFTKSGSSQKAFLYYGGCQGISLSKKAYGLMIVENGEEISSRFYSSENLLKVKQLPDINRNGLSELVFIKTFHFGSMMDYDETWLDIVEYKSDKTFDFLGKATTHWWAGLARDPKNNSANYKIFVKPSAAPTFFRETYRRDKDNQWVLTKALEEFKPEKN